MQWLFEGSEEAPERPGCGLLAGRCYRAACRIEPARRQDSPRRLERARPAPPRLDRRGRAGRRAGLLHAQLRRADHRRHGRGHRTRPAVRRRSSSAATSPACSSIRRNRERSGLHDPAELSAALSLRTIEAPFVRAVQAHHRLPRRSRRPGRQGHQLRGAARGRRSRRARAPLQRGRDRRAGDPRHHGDARAAARAGRHDSPRRARAVHSARGRRRHPDRRRRGGGGRCGRRQGQPEHGGALQSVAHHDARPPLRQPGGRRRDRRRSATRRRRSRSTRAAARPPPAATPSSGRARRRIAAPARSC